MLNKLKPKSEFSRNVLTLMTGTTIAQAIPIAISPILTRLYSPTDFGVFALYLSMAMILSSIATAKYELAIMLPSKNKEAKEILILSIIITTIMSLFSLLIIILFKNQIVQWFDNDIISTWLYFLPLSLFIVGMYQVFNYWSNRHKEYKILAQNKVLQTGSISLASIGFHFIIPGAGGLIISQIFGNFIALIRLLIVSIKKNPLHFKRINFVKLILLAKKYKDFPLYMLPGATINMSAKELSKIIIGILLGAKILGYFALVHRTITLPIGLFASSFQQVFLQRGREDYIKNGECVYIYKKIFKKLFLVSTLLFIPIAPFLPELFTLVFGKIWTVSGEYAQILIPFYFVYMISAPLSQMAVIAEKQKISLYWQIGFFILSIGSIIIGNILFDETKYIIALFSLANTIAFSINIYITYQMAKGKL